MLSFLQEHFENGQTVLTLGVFSAAIVAGYKGSALELRASDVKFPFSYETAQF